MSIPQNPAAPQPNRIGRRVAGCCEHLIDPELTTILSHAEASKKTVEIYVWQQRLQSYQKITTAQPIQGIPGNLGTNIGGNQIPNLQSILEEINSCPQKNPSHPQQGRFRCAVLVIMAALFLLLLLGMQTSQSDPPKPSDQNQGRGRDQSNDQDDKTFWFMIFWFLLTMLFIICFVMRVVHKLKEYTYKRHEIFRDIFRRHLYPGVEYRLSRRGYCLLILLDPTVRGVALQNEHSENMPFNPAQQAGYPHRFALNRSIDMQKDGQLRPQINTAEVGVKVGVQQPSLQPGEEFNYNDEEPKTP